MINAKQFNERQRQRQLAEALARKAALREPQPSPVDQGATPNDRKGRLPGKTKKALTPSGEEGLPQIDRMPLSQWTAAFPETAPDTASDVIKSLGAGVAKGFVRLPGLVGDLEALGRLGINLAARKGFGQPKGWVNDEPVIFTGNDVIDFTKKHLGATYYEPRTMAGRYADSIGENAPALLGPGGPLRALARLVIPAVAGQTAYEYAPSHNDFAKALASIVTGHYAGLPYTARARTDDLLAPLATRYAHNQLKKLGPDSFLFEATNRFMPWASYSTRQGNPGSRALLRKIDRRADNEVIRLPHNVRHSNAANRIEDIEQQFARTQNQFPPAADAKLPPNANAAENHPLFWPFQIGLGKQQTQKQIAERLGLRGNKGADELERLRTHQWLREWEGRLSKLDNVRDITDGINGSFGYRALQEHH
jgi:hypothetical protein